MSRIYSNFKCLSQHSFLGSAVLIRKNLDNIPRHIISVDEIPKELLRLKTALEIIILDLEKIACEETNPEYQELLSFQIKILKGSSFTRGIIKLIEQANLNAEAATEDYTNEIAHHYNTMSDNYLAQRASDFKIMGAKIIFGLTKFKSRIPDTLPPKSVVIADELGPIEMMQLIALSPVAIIVENCGQYSHTAIIASGSNIPVLIASVNLYHIIQDSMMLVYNHHTNSLVIQPTDSELKHYHAKNTDKSVQLLKPPFYYNNTPIMVSANIEPPENPLLARQFNAQGFGLIRTEFLFFQHQTPPTEQEQYNALLKICESIAPEHPIVIRTPDFGGDKTPLYNSLFDEYRGVLSLRGIGLTLKHTELLIPNLQAILRLFKKFPNIRILLPMVKIPQHLIDTKDILNIVAQDLRKNKIISNHDTLPPIGAMIEVPSAAICADLIAPHCDFFSIGGNDLVQFTMAADRNDITQEEYFIHHPEAIFRLIEHTLQASKNHKFVPSMCGDFTNKEFFMRLLKLGIRHFSTSVHHVQHIANLLKSISSDSDGSDISAVQ